MSAEAMEKGGAWRRCKAGFHNLGGKGSSIIKTQVMGYWIVAGLAFKKRLTFPGVRFRLWAFLPHSGHHSSRNVKSSSSGFCGSSSNS